MNNLAPIPRRSPLLTLKTLLVDVLWDRWFTSLLERVNLTPVRIGSAVVSDADAATTTTAVNIQPLEAGMYQVSYSLSLTQAATVSSSLTPTIGWTFNGQSFSQSGAAMTGNTLTTQQNGVFTVNCDASSSITYAVSYASVGATSAQYTFGVWVTA